MYLSAEQRSVCLCADAQSQAASKPSSVSTSIAGPALVAIATAESFTLSASESNTLSASESFPLSASKSFAISASDPFALSTPDHFTLSITGSLTLTAPESNTQSASRITPHSDFQSDTSPRASSSYYFAHHLQSYCTRIQSDHSTSRFYPHCNRYHLYPDPSINS